MSDKANKSKPLAEAVAALYGSTTFRDEFGGGRSTAMPRERIVRALGWVQQSLGPVPVWCMETYYAQTLRHEQALLRAFGASSHTEQPHVTRFGRALAIRSLAGQRYSTTMLGEYAYLLCCRRETLQARMAAAEAWLSEHQSAAESEFRRRLSDRPQAA